jgi:hypothetical protein
VSATPLITPRGVNKNRNWKRYDANLQGIALRAIGTRASFGSVSEGSRRDGSEHSIGGTVTERGIGLLDYGVLDARYFDYIELGGDSKGWTYRADGQLSIGPRWRWSRFTAGVMRIGARAHIARFGGVFTSDIRAPALAVGLRHESTRLHVDAVVEYSPVLAGYFEPPAGSYALRKSQSGTALLSVSWERLRLDAEFTRYWRESAPHSIDECSAWACAYLGWGLICLDGRLQHVPSSEGNRQVTGGSVGLSALIGKYDWLHSD